ncbi:hypothetical protein LEMA_uP006360.1 [Plenodomus lingam JN3]|uniref:Uncharacterized protein n=1 Tax=Leptosphaeria maculans (strain JN3 / isolate v23.1.3 / race Av1-4-5-6-7-8) TaxID=985895 RepID=E5AF60_LEPMJ|nr:hypothetical protein LEMA_uP006360.1 [Plenodomus lingam JN3]CBY01849.1 hypothetical protein LEMA_uP006360.1 [Plenodomus lingam JN3]
MLDSDSDSTPPQRWMNELNTRCTKAECGSPIKIPKLELQQQDSHKHAPEK